MPSRLAILSGATPLLFILVISSAAAPASAIIWPTFHAEFPLGTISGCQTNLVAAGTATVYPDGTGYVGAGDPAIGGFIGHTGLGGLAGGAICLSPAVPLSTIFIESASCSAGLNPGDVGEATIRAGGTNSLGVTIIYESSEGRCVRLVPPG